MKIYDNGGKTWDRYTVFEYNPQEYNRVDGVTTYECLALSDNCDKPDGFSQWSYASKGRHLGKLVKLEDLPTNVKLHIVKRITR